LFQKNYKNDSCLREKNQNHRKRFNIKKVNLFYGYTLDARICIFKVSFFFMQKKNHNFKTFFKNLKILHFQGPTENKWNLFSVVENQLDSGIEEIEIEIFTKLFKSDLSFFKFLLLFYLKKYQMKKFINLSIFFLKLVF
jgi:hypothetical protein